MATVLFYLIALILNAVSRAGTFSRTKYWIIVASRTKLSGKFSVSKKPLRLVEVLAELLEAIKKKKKQNCLIGCSDNIIPHFPNSNFNNIRSTLEPF